MSAAKHEAKATHGSSHTSGLSVVVLAGLLFVALGFSVYVFGAFPFLLGIVLIAEWVILGLAILTPMVSEPARKGWLRSLLAVLVALALANMYMLFLARTWGIEIYGWYWTTLHLQVAVLGGVAHAAGYVIGFLDAMLKALLGLREGPIEGALGAGWRVGADLVGSLLGGDGAPRLPMLLNLAVGLLASVMSAQIIKRLVARTR
jgi:hypothetical protein